ncbi:hypothetical protein D3C72_1878960 [compost metagenome]
MEEGAEPMGLVLGQAVDVREDAETDEAQLLEELAGAHACRSGGCVDDVAEAIVVHDLLNAHADQAAHEVVASVVVAHDGREDLAVALGMVDFQDGRADDGAAVVDH